MHPRIYCIKLFNVYIKFQSTSTRLSNSTSNYPSIIPKYHPLFLIRISRVSSCTITSNPIIQCTNPHLTFRTREIIQYVRKFPNPDKQEVLTNSLTISNYIPLSNIRNIHFIYLTLGSKNNPNLPPYFHTPRQRISTTFNKFRKQGFATRINPLHQIFDLISRSRSSFALNPTRYNATISRTIDTRNSSRRLFFFLSFFF